MASNPKLSTAARNAMGDALITAIGSNGKMKFYTGTQTATPTTAITTQTLLGTLPLSATSAPATSSGVITFNTITSDSSADASGVATWFLITKSDDTGVISGTCGTANADAIMNNTSVTAGSPINCPSAAITMPGG